VLQQGFDSFAASQLLRRLLPAPTDSSDFRQYQAVFSLSFVSTRKKSWAHLGCTSLVEGSKPHSTSKGFAEETLYAKCGGVSPSLSSNKK
jgi:hypothetical protein